jgi:hypothetical protein
MFDSGCQWSYSMVRMRNRTLFVVAAVMTSVLIASAQTQRQSEGLSIQGCPGQANVVRWQGRALVDVQDLARITDGSLKFDKGRMVLTMSPCDAAQGPSDDASKAKFSRAFMKAAIEAMASIREWGGILQVIVQNGYPVEKTTAGNTIAAYQSRAADSVALASTAASTDPDYRGLELLRNEFNNVEAWSEAFVKARSSMSAVNLTMSENPLNEDQDAQKIVDCGQFLAQMFAAGTFEDNAACH